MCIGREIGLHVVMCLGCRKAVDPRDEERGDLVCHCNKIKVRHEGNGTFSEWERP